MSRYALIPLIKLHKTGREHGLTQMCFRFLILELSEMELRRRNSASASSSMRQKFNNYCLQKVNRDQTLNRTPDPSRNQTSNGLCCPIESNTSSRRRRPS